MLRPVKSKAGDDPRRATTVGGAEVPSLPAWKVFVGQFSRETSVRRGTFSGRVEHMTSGRRARFASTRELLAVLRTRLSELGEESSEAVSQTRSARGQGR